MKQKQVGESNILNEDNLKWFQPHFKYKACSCACCVK